MSEFILRTSEATTLGGNLDDVQVGFKVEAIDPETGFVLHPDWIQFSSKGVQHDPVKAEALMAEAAEVWAIQNAENIEAGYARMEAKAPERATVQPILDAINAAPDIVKQRDDLTAVIEAKAQAQAELDAATIDDGVPVIVDGERVG